MSILSSRKEENRLHIVSSETKPAFASVGKVFDSLQGLQQRLDDFSLDDLSKAIETSNTLALRLAELRRRLENLVNISHRLAEAGALIEQAAADISARADLETAGGSPRVKERSSTGNLIPFPRQPKLELDDLPEATQITTETDGANNNASAQAPAENPSPTPAMEAAENRLEPPESPDPSESARPEQQDITPAPQQEPPPVNFILGEPDSTINSKASRPSRLDEAESSSEPEGPDRLGPYFLGPDSEPASAGHEFPDDTAGPAKAGEATALVPVGPDFDQRLLDDLIKNYGEFASSPNVPVAVKPEDDGDGSKESQKASKIAEEESPSPARHLPSIQKEGEIDRKLKKLIKDYGEYDLYSRQGPVNLKTGVIAAFVLLGVIFCGFYFFASPKVTDSSEPSTVSEPVAAPPQAARDLLQSRARKTVKAPKTTRAPAVQLPSTAEASEESALPQ